MLCCACSRYLECQNTIFLKYLAAHLRLQSCVTDLAIPMYRQITRRDKATNGTNFHPSQHALHGNGAILASQACTYHGTWLHSYHSSTHQFWAGRAKAGKKTCIGSSTSNHILAHTKAQLCPYIYPTHPIPQCVRSWTEREHGSRRLLHSALSFACMPTNWRTLVVFTCWQLPYSRRTPVANAVFHYGKFTHMFG